jgi:hypothetical protein
MFCVVRVYMFLIYLSVPFTRTRTVRRDAPGVRRMAVRIHIGIHILSADISPVCRLRLRGRVSKRQPEMALMLITEAGYHASEFVQENYADWMRDSSLLGDDEPYRTFFHNPFTVII